LQCKNKKAYKVSVSLYDAAIASLKNQATNWLMANKVPKPIGSLHPNIAPYGETFYTKDNKPVVLAIGSDKQFIQLLSLLNLTELADNPQFANNSNRVKNREKLAQFLASAIKKINRDELINSAQKHNIPISPILSVDEVFENPKAKALVLEEEIDNIPTKRVKTAVFKIE
jgi:crotonobetainyl-CoA:carnitine CoA-transferase CaiB-like acyl-CoA transferase